MEHQDLLHVYEELDVSEGLGSSDLALFLATQWEQELFKRHHLSLHFSQEGKVNISNNLFHYSTGSFPPLSQRFGASEVNYQVSSIESYMPCPRF